MVSTSGANTAEINTATELTHHIIQSMALGKPFLSFGSYKNQDDYLDHMNKLFGRYDDGTALSWEDSGRLYNRITHPYPLCKHGAGVYDVSPFRDKKSSLQLLMTSFGALTQADIIILRNTRAML